MKTCSRCKTEKPLGAFRKRTASRDGLSSWCAVCFNAYEKERYQNGDKVRKQANKAKIIEGNQQFVLDYLLTHPCVDCGEADPIVLEFDHRGDKLGNIAEMYEVSRTRLAAEIAKCDVRCANCHRRRTANQFGSWRLLGKVLG